MIRLLISVVLTVLITGAPVLAYQSLQEIYLAADGRDGYDKYIELDPDIEYLGDLRILAGLNVYLDGNGAIVHAQNSNLIHIGVNGSNLDIQNCVLIGGLGGIYFINGSSGTIMNNTVTGCSDAGVKVITPAYSPGTYVYDNIITDCFYGFYCNEGERPHYLGFNTVYNAGRYRYAQFCPS